MGVVKRMTEKPMPVEEVIPCMACGQSEFRLVQRTAEHTTKKGQTVSFPDELTQCVHCEEEFYTHEQSMAHSRALTAAVAKVEELFAPDRIRTIRMRLGLSQEKFELALGVGRKTVIRWERGTVPPSRAANGLLWFADRYPSLFLEFAQQRLPRPGTSKCEVSHYVQTMIEACKTEPKETKGALLRPTGGKRTRTMVKFRIVNLGVVDNEGALV